MHITGAHHIALHTSNFSRLRQFYVEMLGLREVGGFPGQNIIFLATGNILIELEEIEEQQRENARSQRGWQHVALQVADVDEAYAQLIELGVRFLSPPENYPEQGSLMRIAFFTDPDGNVIELLQPLSGDGYLPRK